MKKGLTELFEVGRPSQSKIFGLERMTSPSSVYVALATLIDRLVT